MKDIELIQIPVAMIAGVLAIRSERYLMVGFCILVIVRSLLRINKKISEEQSFEKPDKPKPETTNFRKLKRKAEVN